MLTRDQIEAFFLLDDSPLFERIQELRDFAEAYVMARLALDKAGKKYGYGDLIAVVKKIRSPE